MHIDQKNPAACKPHPTLGLTYAYRSGKAQRVKDPAGDFSNDGL